MKRNAVPVAPETLLINLNRFFNSVPLNALRTTVRELDNALNGRGDDLGRLLDYNNQLLNTAMQPQNVNDTVNLIKSSAIVLQTQLDEQQPLASWTHSLRLLSDQFVKSDPDIRHLFNTGPSDLGTVTKFIQDNRTDLGVVFANLDTFGRLLVRYQGGIEEVLELYPALAAGGPTTLHDHIGALGLVLQNKPDPQDCGDPHHDRQGYNGVRRGPEALYPIAPDVSTRCTAPLSSGTNVRGSAHVPGGDPISVSGGGYAYPDVVSHNMRASNSGSPVLVGEPTTPNAGRAGNSWLNLLSAGIR
jgi:phospholipid/cholesterol/gamma-HCH transport system substrate-binding protein